ncbi:MAG: archaeosortase/exosortase family protein [Candidatus Aenigmarchaeota archaeon]|nr:archaeosortase/exosortase family protein [Candidatus Aenigmarchaeota archaeon]
MKARNRRKKVEPWKKVLQFLIAFNALAIPLYIAMYTGFEFQPLQEFNSQMLYYTLQALGYNVQLDGSSIHLIAGLEAHKIDVSWDSTGWKSMYAVAALIIATPISTMEKKGKFILAGIAAMFVLNYLRITTTIIISATYGFGFFDVVHTVLWREGLILAVVGYWFFWLRRENYKIGER